MVPRRNSAGADGEPVRVHGRAAQAWRIGVFAFLGFSLAPQLLVAGQALEPEGGAGTSRELIVALVLLCLLALLSQRFFLRRRATKLARKLMAQVTEAIASRQLYERELLVNRFAQEAARYLDLDALLLHVARRFSRVFAVGRVAVFIPEQTSGALRLAALASSGESVPIPPRPLTMQRMIEDAFEQGELKMQSMAAGEAPESTANLALPLKCSGKCCGVLVLERFSMQAVRTEEIGLVQRLAEVAALSLENARSHTELARVKQAWEKTFAVTWTGLEKTFGAVAEPAFIHDADYNIQQFNEAFQRRVGLQSRDILGQKCFEVLFHKNAPCSYCPYRRQERQPTTQTAEVDQGSDKGILRISSFSRVDASGNNLGALEIVRDTTPEIRLQEQLLHAEKLASIGKLVSGVAHELNNPLTAILGHAQLLERRASDDKTKGKVKMILDEAGRASKIVRNLLTFARKHKPEQQLIDLNEVIQKTLALREYELNLSRIQVNMNLAENLPIVIGDFHQLQQVLLNLITNAEQAMLETRGEGVLTIESYCEDGRACLKVQDNGPGIPPEIGPRIFDPFFTTKSVGKGTGLGLSICYGILSEHHGKITVESEPEQGAKFFVSLPAAGEKAEELAIERPAQPFLLSKRRVLVTTNDSGVWEVLEDALKPAGAQIEIEYDSEKGLAKCLSSDYDLVFAEWKIPGENRLVDWLGDERPALATRCILLANRFQREEVEKFCERTGAAWLQKPIMFAELRVVVEKVLAPAPTPAQAMSTQSIQH